MSSKKPVKKQPRKQVSSWVIFFISLAIIVALVAVIKFTGNPKPIVPDQPTVFTPTHRAEIVLEDYGTVSATALYLLKTLRDDKIMAPYDIQMIPCCGHTLLPNDDLTEVNIIGCPNGIDWTVEHVQQGVKITTDRGSVTFVPMNVYREEIFRVGNKIEDYYKRCEPKTPADDFDKRGYAVFWNEWHRRRHS